MTSDQTPERALSAHARRSSSPPGETMTPQPKGVTEQRITEYLLGGGLFNPEQANHDAVRDLLIDCRTTLSDLRAENARLQMRGGKLIDDVERESGLCISQVAWDVGVLDIVKELKEENARLLRGEFICKKCGIRKDSDHERGDF